MDKKLDEQRKEKKEDGYIYNEEICKLVLRYIKKENTEYAILIDGKWGVGKTFFVKNSLKGIIQEEIKEASRYKNTIYMSLYGIKDIKQIENKIIYSIIENNILNNQRKTSRILMEVVKTYINSLKKKDSIMEGIKIFQEIDKYIIIFDDLERCMVPITELLGYINELVEHKCVKTILIANEDKMSEKGSLAENKIYYEIKEKLIGEVIYYNPNIDIILDYICDKENNQIVSKIIKNNKYRIIEIMQIFNYKNIRTLKICVSKFNRIIEKIEEAKNIYIDYNEKIYNRLLDNILIYLLYVTIMYKENMKLYDWSTLLGSFGIINLTIRDEKIEILGFKFIDKFVQYSIIDIEDIKKILYQYNKRDQNDIYGKGSPFDIITNFFGKKDEEVEEALKSMKNEIESDIYMKDLYSKILCYLLEIRYAEYDEELLKTIISLMEYNIKNHKNNCITEFIPCTLGYNTEKSEYYDILNKWEIYDREQVIKNRKLETIHILKQKKWGKEFREYCEYSKYEFERNKSFFSSIDDKELLNSIRMSDAQNILELIRGINNIHSFKYILKDQKELKDYYKSDIDSILKIKEGIETIKSQEMEKGKRYVLNELTDTLENWINKLK